MFYYFAKTIHGEFNESIARVTEALKREGFGVLTDIDVKATLQAKLGVGFHNYRILGACNPPFAYRALQAEDKIGTMLPCNVIVQEGAGADRGGSDRPRRVDDGGGEPRPGSGGRGGPGEAAARDRELMSRRRVATGGK